MPMSSPQRDEDYKPSDSEGLYNIMTFVVRGQRAVSPDAYWQPNRHHFRSPSPLFTR